LTNHLLISEIYVSLDDGFGDVFSHFSFSLELEIFDEAGIFVHGEDNVGHSF
jgi:hypothetical protein